MGGSVVSYPVMRANGIKFRTIIWRLGKRCWANVVFPASAPVPSSFQPKKQTHNAQWGLLRKDLVILHSCEVGGQWFNSQHDQLQKDLQWSRNTYLWFVYPFSVPWSQVDCVTVNGVSQLANKDSFSTKSDRYPRPS